MKYSELIFFIGALLIMALGFFVVRYSDLQEGFQR